MLKPIPANRLLLPLLALALGGCLTTGTDREPRPADLPERGEEGRDDGPTLADLEETEITVEPGELGDVPAEAALESYRRAVQLFQDDERRSASLRRMADLALAAAEEDEGLEVDEEMLREEPMLLMDEELEQELDRDIDRMLYENFMREAQEAEDREERLALLDLAGGMIPGLDEEELDTDYSTAILLYESVLETSEHPDDRAEAKYLLAKAHDLAGNWDETLDTLDRLTESYPESRYYVEAQFRRGEMYFSMDIYDTARDAYTAVIDTGGPESDFFHQGLYKKGWSEYLVADYEDALESFFVLVDDLYDAPELRDEPDPEDGEEEREARMLSALMGDTQRAISLSFAQLDGPETVREWFAERDRDYEHHVYRSLGEFYLSQRRFRDAAETFRTYAETNPMSRRAPQFSSLQVDAYQRGGFPDLVLPAKEEFVELYGVDSDYWSEYPDRQEDYAEVLQGHILDIARHFHARAQRADDREAYEKPAQWYAEFLRTPPETERHAEINHRYAEVLFSARRFEDAVDEFERTAYEYPDYEDADRAAYFAIVSYQNLIRELPDETEEELDARLAWIDRKIASGLQFADTHPGHERVPQVLRNVVQDQLEQDDIEGAVSSAGRLVNLEPEPSDDYMRFGWATIADGEFELGNYQVAEFAYRSLLRVPGHDQESFERHNDRLGATIYRQAEAAEEKAEAEGDEDKRRELLAAAADEYLRVGRIAPESEARKAADYDAGALYMDIEDYASAIPVLEAFRERFPDDELAENVPDQLAIAYEEAGDYARASTELERIADRDVDEDPTLARQALWEAAQLRDRTDDLNESVRLYRRYANEWPEPFERNSEAMYRLASIYEDAGDDASRRVWLGRLVDNVHEAGDQATDRVAYLGAWAAFEYAEPEYQEFSGIRLTQPLQQSLTRKTRAMEEALDAYELVLDLGVRDYVTAAQFRMGDMYRQLAEDILDSERPAGLSDLELDQYELLLEDEALPYEDMAIDMLIENADLAADGIYDEHVRSSFDALSDLLPGRYAKHEQVEDYVDIIY